MRICAEKMIISQLACCWQNLQDFKTLSFQYFYLSLRIPNLLAVWWLVILDFTSATQNRRQKVFNKGTLRDGFTFVRGGMTFKNWQKLYWCIVFFLGVGALFGGLNPPKPPVATRLLLQTKRFPLSTCSAFLLRNLNFNSILLSRATKCVKKNCHSRLHAKCGKRVNAALRLHSMP